MPFRAALLLCGALLLGLASDVRAAFEIEGVNQVTFTWSDASGPVAGYAVYVTRNTEPEALYDRVADNRVTIGGVPGDTVVVRVAAEDGLGNQGPLSPASEPLSFALPEPPPPAHVVHDFDGDGFSDLLLRDPVTGSPVIYTLVDGVLEQRAELPSLPLDWRVAATGDMDGNGVTDLVLTNDAGRLTVWLIDSGTLVGGALLGDLLTEGWSLAAAADFDADGRDELLLRHAASGALELWRLDTGDLARADSLVGGPGPEWTLPGARDFDGDGRADLLWHAASLGRLHLWRTPEAGGLAGSEEIVVDDALATDWRALAVGDFDGDGLADGLLEELGDGSDVGRIAVRSPFTAVAPELAVPTPATQRELLTTGDFDGDGREDVMWRNVVAGDLELWLLEPDGVVVMQLDDPLALGAPAAVGCPGDLDLDGHVGVPDISQAIACFRSAPTGSCAGADLDGDGRVGLPDYGILQGLFGQACPAP